MRQHETYLADGCYVHFDGMHVVLTTGHHSPIMADNIVYLDATVIEALMHWLIHTAKLVKPVDKDGNEVKFVS